MQLGIHLIIAAMSFALLASGAAAMYVESNAYVIGGHSSFARVANWTVEAPQPGWSIATEDANLLDCANVLSAANALAMRYLDEGTKSAIAPTCLALARAVTTNATAASFAWYVEALALSRMSNFAEMNDALRRSQLTGANEQWIAELRVALAETHLDQLQPAVLQAHESDLSMLVLSARGISSIARRYTTDTGFRHRIVAIVETLSPQSQQDFLNHVRSALSKSR